MKSLDDIKQIVVAWAWGGKNGEGLPPPVVFSFGGGGIEGNTKCTLQMFS